MSRLLPLFLALALPFAACALPRTLIEEVAETAELPESLTTSRRSEVPLTPSQPTERFAAPVVSASTLARLLAKAGDCVGHRLANGLCAPLLT